MLNIQKLTFYQRGLPLLKDINLQVFNNQRVGLVGKNGCGKSTLFCLIRKEIKPDSGEVTLQPGKTIASVEQEIVNSNQSAIEFVLDGDIELRQLEKKLACEIHDASWFEAQQRFESIDGYTARARAAQLLNGLGFVNKTQENPVCHFSGGWRMRLNLARALMKRADLLLLDEPTNHLDLEAIVWLEQYLANFPGSLIMVSHDREFLNASVTRIAYIHDCHIESYTGNYDQFESMRAERVIQQTNTYQQQQKKIEHMEDFVRRFRAKATKAKQAQSRLKALERLVRVAPAYIESGHFQLKIEAPARSPDVLLSVKNLCFGYNENLLLKNINFVLQSGARVALIGPNGAGKSTFIRLLVSEIKPISGSLSISPDIRIGYFAQHQLENLDCEATPLRHMERLAPSETTLVLRNFLGRFGFARDNEDRAVASFSGGEKSRLALALLAWQKPHLLLLDEPTNHLDLDMRDALTLALEEFTGAVVLVSHDRSLVRAIADQLWLVADGGVKLFDGDLDDYKNWVQTIRTNESKQSHISSSKSRQKSVLSRPNKKALISKKSKLEDALAIAQKQLSEASLQLADPMTYANQTLDEIDKLSKIHANLEQKICELEENWLALEVELEEN